MPYSLNPFTGILDYYQNASGSSGDMLKATYDAAAVNQQLVGISATQTLTNKTVDASLNTISNISNTEIKAAAAIAVNKLAAVTASRALVSDASGFVSAATTTSAEIGFVNGVTSAIQTQINAKQASDATLTALAAYNTNGLLTQTAADTFAGRTLTGPAAGVSVSNGDGVAGNPTIALANDLAAVEGLASTGIATRTAADTWTVRTITGTANQVTVTNGDGVSGNPTLSLPTNIRVKTLGATFDGGGSALSTGKAKGYITCPYSGTITAWSIGVDTGTATLKTWKVATGTAVPTSANSINTSGVAISTGTYVRSTTVSDFTTTTVTANDIFAFNIEAISGATQLTIQLEITSS